VTTPTGTTREATVLFRGYETWYRVVRTGENRENFPWSACTAAPAAAPSTAGEVEFEDCDPLRDDTPALTLSSA